MKIPQIILLAEIIHAIQGEAKWEVATQTYPDQWFPPRDRSLQWFIDANWLIRVGDLVYNPMLR